MYDYLAEKAGLRPRSLIKDMLATRRTGTPSSDELKKRRIDIAAETATKAAKAESATRAEPSAPFEAPTSGPFRHAYDDKGRSIGGPFGMSLRSQYAKEEEAKRKKRLEQAGTTI